MESQEKKLLLGIIFVFMLFYFLPAGSVWFAESVLSGLDLLVSMLGSMF
jgi:hypothetical protein